MSGILIYHNGECSKSKGATEILKEKGIAFDTRYYLLEPLSAEELTDLVQLLKVPAKELVRTTDPIFEDQFSDVEFDEEGWIELLVTYPELMQRPVVVNVDRAIIARPPEKVLEIL